MGHGSLDQLVLTLAGFNGRITATAFKRRRNASWLRAAKRPEKAIVRIWDATPTN